MVWVQENVHREKKKWVAIQTKKLPCKFSYLIQYDGDNQFGQHGRQYMTTLQYKQPQAYGQQIKKEEYDTNTKITRKYFLVLLIKKKSGWGKKT